MSIEAKQQAQIQAVRKLREAYRLTYHNRGPVRAEYTTLFAAIEDVLSLGLPAPSEAPATGKCIVLDKAEVQSGVTRVKWAENLIKQLDMATLDGHEGAKSWLLNYAGDKTVVTDLPEPEPSGVCSNSSGEATIELELPYRRAVQLSANMPAGDVAGFYSAVAEDGTMWVIGWDEASEWTQIPCLPNGPIDL